MVRVPAHAFIHDICVPGLANEVLHHLGWKDHVLWPGFNIDVDGPGLLQGFLGHLLLWQNDDVVILEEGEFHRLSHYWQLGHLGHHEPAMKAPFDEPRIERGHPSHASGDELRRS